MNIEFGKLYENRTVQLLLPCINSFGEGFTSRYNKLLKLAAGVHDTLLDHSPLIYGNNLYVCFDTSYNNEDFYEFIDYLIDQDYFQAEYSVDEDLSVARKHMIVVNVPECHNEDYKYFLKGEYSKMYTEEFRKEHFLDKGRLKELKILTKDKTMIPVLMNHLEIDFKSEVLEEELQNHEVVLPLKRREEIFNCSKNQRVFFNEELDKVWQN